MAVYATNISKDTIGVVKPKDGADHLIPPQVVDFVISGIDLSDVVYSSAFVFVSSTPTGGTNPGSVGPTPYYLFRFQGYIQYSTDFPMPSKVSKGDTYVVTNVTGVVDNSVTRTNTGQSFSKGDQIYWNGTGWSLSQGGDDGDAGDRWQRPVIDRVTVNPGGESIGDRYLIIAPATGDFAGKENYIAELTASGWEFTAPETNMSVVVSTTDSAYTYDHDTAAWVEIAGPEILFAVGAGLYKPNPNKLEVDLDPAGGLGFNPSGDTGQIRVEVIDGGTF